MKEIIAEKKEIKEAIPPIQITEGKKTSASENKTLSGESKKCQECGKEHSEKSPAKKIGLLRRMLRPKVLKINARATEKGLHLILSWGSNERKFNVLFPEEIWNSMPGETKSIIIDNLAHLSSLEIGIMLKARKISYETPLPLFKSFFIEVLLKCLLYSGDCDSGKTIDYITRLCNLDFSFKGSQAPFQPHNFETKEGSINTMTFGKESLLGFGLCQELGLNPIPVTVFEPDADVVYRNQHIKTFGNKHKHKLIKQFEQEFKIKIYSIDSELNDIMDYTLWDLDPTDLGWSTQLTQYLFLLLPFNHFFRQKYTIYGNEYSCDAFYYSQDGFKCHPVYDQSVEWMNHINAILQTITHGAVKATSLVQPLHEFAVAKILYQRYPQLAKYQTSCHGNNEGAKKNRWCGACCKCANCFVFMKALGFDPESVGLRDMFGSDYRDYYYLFTQGKTHIDGYSSIQLARDEELLAFYLAAKKGAAGELIGLFKKDFWEEAVSREEELKNEFFKIHRPENIPSNLWRKIKPIFEEELKKNGSGIEVEKEEKLEEQKKNEGDAKMKEETKSEIKSELKTETKKEGPKEEAKTELKKDERKKKDIDSNKKS